MPKFRKVIGGTKKKKRCIAKALYVGDASLQRYGPSNWVWLSSEIKQNHWRVLKGKESCTLYQFRADVQTHDAHRPRNTADSDVAGTGVSAVRMSTLSHTSCGRLGESLVSKNERRTLQVCVLLSNRHQHETFRLGRMPTFTLRTVQRMATVRKHRRFIIVCVQIICRPSPTENWYICTEQVQHRTRKISLYAAIWWGLLQRFEKNPSTSTLAIVHAVGVGRCLVWHVVCKQELHSFHRQKVQAVLGPNDWLPSSRPVCSLVCAPVYREARLFRSGVFHGWCLLHPREDFQQPQQRCLGRSKPSNASLTATTNNVSWSKFGRALCIFTVCSGRKATRNAGGNPVSQVSVRRVREHLTATTTIARLAGRGGGAMAWPPRSPDLTPMDFFLHIGATLKPRFTRCQLILKRILLPLLLSAHVSLCCVVIVCISRSVAVGLFICYKLVQNTAFFSPRILQWFCLISNLSQTKFDGP